MDCLAELRALVPLYRRLTAQLGQAEAAAPQRAMLGRLSVALLLWKEIDLRVAELEAERALGSALLANCLGEQVNTDDPELLTRLEMYQEAAAGCAQLADLAPAARDGWLVTLVTSWPRCSTSWWCRCRHHRRLAPSCPRQTEWCRRF